MGSEPIAEDIDMPEAERRVRAMRTVASCAHDVDDLTELLDMLGLKAEEAHPQPQAAVPTQRGKRLLITELTALLVAGDFTSQPA